MADLDSGPCGQVIPVEVGTELKTTKRNIDRLIAILGDNGFDEAREKDGSKDVAQVVECHLSEAEQREEVPLWEAVRVYLGLTREAKMVDVFLFLHRYA